MNSSGTVLYTGETDVLIQENIITQVSLTLNPVPGSTGSIYIYISWGINSGSNWIDYINNPLLSKTYESYEKYGVAQPVILHDSTVYKMWYTGLNDNGRGYILYAYSADGISWQKPLTNPVISPGTAYNAWDRGSVCKAVVLLDNGIYKLYYAGWSDQNSNWNIGLASSLDGITWEKHSSPVLLGTSGWEYQVTPSSILKRDGVYYLYYTGRELFNNSYNYKLGLATSTDGINFTRCSSNPIFSPTLNWEGTGVACGNIISDGGIFKMVYQNAEANAFGKATSPDGITWNRSPLPFFKKENTINGWGSLEIFSPYLVKTDNEYRVYYSGYSYFLNMKIGFTKSNLF